MDGIWGFVYRRFFSGSRVLDFRDTDSLDSQGVLFDEAEAVKEDEGLEIAKIGIAGEIVKNLARRGITKLFPIQVIDVSLSYVSAAFHLAKVSNL